MTNTYTINDIQSEMQAAGSHWWDRGTLRFFRCRVGSQVYQGSGGIFFVTSEAYDEHSRKYTVRQYDPSTKQVETIGEFNSMTRAQAHSLAKRMAGPAAIVAQLTYVPASPSSQLALDIVRGGGECTEPMAAYLIRLATAHQKAMEDYCNGVEIYDAEGEAMPPLKRLRAKIQAAARDAGCGVVLSGDPRGCTVKLVLPDGSTDDWGKTGWCVPTRS